MDTLDLTSRQRQILDFIEQRSAQDGRPPTRMEIASAFGFRSPNAAEEHLRALERKGVIRLDGGRARGISLLAGQRNVSGAPRNQLPVIGQVAAGTPILAVEHIESHLQVDPALFRPRADFLLRVRGDSMREAGILDGDLLAVHRTASVQSGQIGVVRIEEEVTVKRIVQEAGHWVLQAANPEFAPRRMDPGESWMIEGLAVGVLRTALSRRSQ